METEKKPGLLISFIPVGLLIVLMTLNVVFWGEDSSYGPNQLALLLGGLLSGMLGFVYCKIPYKVLEQRTIDSVKVSLQPIFILLIVGMLIGIWILAGIVPAMIYYGVQIISPSFFLPTALIICAVVSLATGSSWSTVGTVGIALIGVGQTLGIDEGMVAGAIVSGSYFGDKMSPLSDTTNLAPAMAGSDLFEHIKHMIYTSGPAFLLAFILFCLIGFGNEGNFSSDNEISKVVELIDAHFNISLWLFTLPVLIFTMVGKKVPALPALMVGCLVGAVYAVLFQGETLSKLSEGKTLYEVIIQTAYNGYELNTGNVVIDKLLSRGGMSNMLNTVWLIMMAMVFGGMMEATGMLGAIANGLLKLIRGTVSLVSATIGTAIFLNLTTSDQYISIVVSGRIFRDAYRDYGLKAKNLSRAVEDGGTVTSVLVPWNTCGAYFSSVMGVATLTYLPFAFFNLLSPIVSISLAAMNKTMEPLEASLEDGSGHA